MGILDEVLADLGYINLGVGFLVLGFGIGKFTTNAYKKAAWQVQIALVIGLFGLLVGLTHYSGAGAMGMFALGSGVAIILSEAAKKEEDMEELKNK
jgi:hypothetical protein